MSPIQYIEVTIYPPTTDQLKYWFLLLRAPGIGSKTFVKILSSFLPHQLFSQSHSSLLALGLRAKSIEFIKIPDWTLIEKDLLWLQQPGNDTVTILDDLYPDQLKEIDNPPPLLFLRGDKALLSQPQIAIVGSRNPSTVGKGGLTSTSALLPSIDAIKAVSSPQMYAP